MDRMEYTSAVATMRVYEKRLLDQSRLDRLVEAKDGAEAFRILQETEYARSMGGVKKPEDFEAVLKTELEHVYKDLYSMTKDRELIELLALKYDYQNLKMLLKNWALEKETEKEWLGDMGTISTGILKSGFDSGDLRSFNPYMQEAIKITKDDYEKNKDPQRIDILVDSVYYRQLSDMGEKWKEIPIVRDYIKNQIDRYNILALLRMKKQEKDGKYLKDIIAEGGEIKKDAVIAAYTDSMENLGSRFKTFSHNKRLRRGIALFQETGSFSGLERELDNGVMDMVKPSKLVNFGPEPLFAYVVAKERENKLLRIIMVSKINNIPPEKIRERLRDLYV